MAGAIRKTRTPWLFLAPFILIFATFTVYPLIDSVRLAFHRPVGVEHEIYVGWDNFRLLCGDWDFWKAVGRTTYFAGMSLLVQLPLALSLAMLVNSRALTGRSFFRTAFFLPVLIGPVFIGIAFKRIFGLQDGLLNQILASVGVSAVDWLRDPDMVMNTLVLTGVWMFAGFNMVYFLAALQSVPAELYDAATIDGAGPGKQFLAVTLPGIWPVAAFLVTASMIGSFGLFDLPWVLTDRGGPGDASTTVMVYLYKRGFIGQDLGYAAAMGWMVTVMLLIAALVQLKISKAWDA